MLQEIQLIDASEQKLLIGLYKGVDERELLSMPAVKEALSEKGTTLDALLDDLEQRIGSWASDRALQTSLSDTLHSVWIGFVLAGERRLRV